MAYVMGREYVEDSSEFKDIIDMIFSDDDRILSRVCSLGASEEIKNKLHLKED